jgi:hypothetical protein
MVPPICCHWHLALLKQSRESRDALSRFSDELLDDHARMLVVPLAVARCRGVAAGNSEEAGEVHRLVRARGAPIPAV